MPKLTNQQAQALACWLIEMTDIAWERRDNFKTAAEANAEAEGLRSLCDLLTGTYLESEGNRLRAVCDNLIETNNKEHGGEADAPRGACILTAENMHTADDCTLHEHEPPE